MPEEQERFHNAVAAMLNSVMFENWLRFYFLREDEVSEGKYVLSIAIPEKALDRIRERFFEFYPMAEELNGRELSLDVSRSAVCNFIRDTYEGELIPQGSLSAYFDTYAFQIGLQLFNIWVQAYEQSLEQNFLDFADWQNAFAQWCATEQATEIREELKAELKRHEH